MSSARTDRFALLDRDGTIIIDKVYLADPDGVEFSLGALAGMKLLRDAGVRLILVTNQSGIARGYFTADDLARVHARLEDMLAREGLQVDAIYHCPHGPNDGCDCRKPSPGMALQAMRDFRFAAADAVFIGDSAADMGAAKASGMHGVRIGAQPDAAPDFLEAARRALAWFDHVSAQECT